MFAGLIKQAKEAASHLILRYVARASVAVPFVIALGFAVAAVAAMVVERFGFVTGCWIMAAGLAAIGAIAAIVVAMKEHEEEVADEQAENADTEEVVSEAATQAVIQAPIALLGPLLATPGGLSAGIGALRVLGRNIPLVLLLAAIGVLLWPTADKPQEPDVDEPAIKPNGSSVARRDASLSQTMQ